jgi:LPS O-antigen subunit length determinant protein (WzzB/FepE family)
MEPQTSYDDEIDLFQLFETIWEGKWLIVAITAVATLMGGLFAFTRPAEFVSTTDIRPITTAQFSEYSASNALGFFEIERDQLRNLLIEQFQERTTLEQAVREFELVSRDKFESNEAYQEAVIQVAASAELLQPDPDGKTPRLDWQLTFEGIEEEKWLQALDSAKRQATENVRDLLSERFETAVVVAQQKRAFDLEDLDAQIDSAKLDYDVFIQNFELERSQGVEDLTTKIANARADYQRKTQDRLAFLNEQAAIARQLGVAKNTLEAQTFASTTGVVANVKTDTPFYLRGYEAIEKEIELINSRDETDAFVSGLFELQSELRALEQDQTLARAESNKEFLEQVLDLERQKRVIEQDKTIQRAQELFATTPIANPDRFVAVQMNVLGSDIQSKSKRMLIVALSVVLGGMIGVLYVLIRSGMRNRKQAV